MGLTYEIQWNLWVIAACLIDSVTTIVLDHEL